MRYSTDPTHNIKHAGYVTSRFLSGASGDDAPYSVADNPFFRLATAPGLALAAEPPKSLRLLVVDSDALHALAAPLLEAPSNALGVSGAEAATICSMERAFDIIFLAVRTSTLRAIVLAAHLRAVERQRAHPRRTAIIGCTVRNSQYLDCLVPGSGFSGALDLPWTQGTVHACLDRWKNGKHLAALGLLFDVGE